MADCKIVNQAVSSCVTKISSLATEYATAGDALVTAFTNAISEAEGDAKDALLELFEQSYKPFVAGGTGDDASSVESMVKSLSDLLEGNRTNFIDVDSKIAESIRGN